MRTGRGNTILFGMLCVLFAAFLAACGGGGSSPAGSVAPGAATETLVNAVTAAPFPIGTWKGPHNISFTVKDLVNKSGTDNFYSGSVSYPTFSGGIVNVSGAMFGDMGSINYVQNNSLAVTAMSAVGFSVTSFNFIGDGTSENNMKPPITSLPGQLVIVSGTTGFSFNERATFVKQ